ncbi:MAG: hypothetical protein Q8942_18745, partial [Bacillota bacterium]|nr:hypothetical protein [Bacillota bacterium]
MAGSLYMGDLDSERYWGDDNLAKLPSFEDSSSLGIIHSMDELLFPFCSKDGDVLITRFAFDNALKEYLYAAGFRFRCNSCDFHTEISDAKKTIFEIIAGDESKLKDFLDSVKGCTYFSPYSIAPYSEILREKVNFINSSPSFEAVKRVNSKEYSTILSKKLGFGSHSNIVYSSHELMIKGKELLEKGNFLIKELYGVSGKGNLLISSLKLLERIVKYVESSEAKGKACAFVIEEFLDRELDYSCGFIISEDGKTEIVSIQKILNHQFAYGGSEAADENFINFLYEKGYFETIESISKELYKDGYFGEVCVDSMLVKSGAIAPVIEINARKSMGFVNNRIDSRLSRYGLKGNLMNINLGVPDDLKFEDILDKLEDKNILYHEGKEYGIIPVSSNTLFINRKLSGDITKSKIFKGRMYLSVISKDTTEKEKLING